MIRRLKVLSGYATKIPRLAEPVEFGPGLTVLSLDSQLVFWTKLVPYFAARVQLVIASHSPFCLGAVAHFVEFEPGYIEKARAAVRMLCDQT